MNSKKWKKELQEEVQPKELISFIQKITSVNLPPVQFQGLLKLFCIEATIKEEIGVEEAQKQDGQPGAQASLDIMEGQVPKNDGCAPSSPSASQSKPKARPYDELLSELIDKYIQLGKTQRAEILELLDELEKENKSKPKPKSKR